MKWILIGKHSFHSVAISKLDGEHLSFAHPPPCHLIQCFFRILLSSSPLFFLFFVSRARCFCFKLNIFPLTAASVREHTNARQCSRHRHTAKAIINFVHFLYLFWRRKFMYTCSVRFAGCIPLQRTCKTLSTTISVLNSASFSSLASKSNRIFLSFAHEIDSRTHQKLFTRSIGRENYTRKRSFFLSSFHWLRLSFGVDFRARSFMRAQTLSVVPIDGVRHLHELPITNFQDANGIYYEPCHCRTSFPCPGLNELNVCNRKRFAKRMCST